MSDIEQRLRNLEDTHLVGNDHGERIKGLEVWREAFETTVSGAAIHFQYLVERFDKLDRRLDKGDDFRQKILVGTILGVVSAVIGIAVALVPHT